MLTTAEVAYKIAVQVFGIIIQLTTAEVAYKD